MQETWVMCPTSWKRAILSSQVTYNGYALIGGRINLSEPQTHQGIGTHQRH